MKKTSQPIIVFIIYASLIGIAWQAYQACAFPADGFYSDSFYTHPISLRILLICKALLLPSILICQEHNNSLTLNYQFLICTPILQTLLLSLILRIRRVYLFLALPVYVVIIVILYNYWFNHPSEPISLLNCNITVASR